MPSVMPWIKAARLRTLPLAMASVLMGGGLAFSFPGFNWLAVLFAAITTLFLQVLSNFANDFGDFTSGVDNQKRVGPARTLQSGDVSTNQMKGAIMLLSILSLVSGLLLLFLVASISTTALVIFVFLGLLAIISAIFYTVGSNPYGYKGFGEVFVFLFFGLVAVGGTWFLATGFWKWSVVLPGSAMGMLSAAVLNINNMRDIENDTESGKKTIASRLGFQKAFYLHTTLVLMPFLFLVAYIIIEKYGFIAFSFLLILPFFVTDIFKIKKTGGGKALDPFLRSLAIKTFLLALIYILLIIFFDAKS